jgi:hypothetical protein
MDPKALDTTIRELHARSASRLDVLLSVHLEPKQDDRFNRFHNHLFAARAAGELSAEAGSALDLTHHVREGFTAATYHQRNAARIEEAVLEICRQAYSGGAADLPRTTMSFGARSLSYEYHAFLFTIRAAIDYLGRAIACYFGTTGKFMDLPKFLKPLSAPAADAIVRRVQNTSLRDIVGPRNDVAHEWPVGAGGFELRWVPGRPVELELVGGGEDLPVGVSVDAPRIGPLLQSRLDRFEDLVYEMLAILPEFTAAVAAAQAEDV